MKYRLKSFTNHGVVFEVDTLAPSCSCLAFKNTGTICEHLEAFGVFAKKYSKLGTHPTFSQALSGLVKSLRLRRQEDAVYWLYYLWSLTDAEGKNTQYRYRIARRLLIGSAEDGVSIAVMEKVAANWLALTKKDATIVAAAAEVVRICKAPNWWADEGGHGLIQDYAIAWRRGFKYKEWGEDNYPNHLTKFKAAFIKGDLYECLYRAMAMVPGSERVAPPTHAKLLGEAMTIDGVLHPQAARLLNIHAGAKWALSGDNNFTTQAVYHALGKMEGSFQEILPVTKGEVIALLDAAHARWKKPQPIPGWCCDGVHCMGNDRRFAGMLDCMSTVIEMWKKFGKADPDQEWPDGIWFKGGLQYEEVE